MACGAPAGSSPRPAQPAALEGRHRGTRGTAVSRRACAGRRAASRRGRGSRRAPPSSLRQHRGHVGRDELGVARREAAVDVHVRPRPQLVGRREDGRGRRPRCTAAACRDCPVPSSNSSSVEHDQRDPRAQPAGGQVGRGRRVAPREVLVVELDVRQVVGLEVGDPVARLGAHDRARARCRRCRPARTARPSRRPARSACRRRRPSRPPASSCDQRPRRGPSRPRRSRRSRSGSPGPGAATAGTSSVPSVAHADQLEVGDHVQRAGERRVGRHRLRACTRARSPRWRTTSRSAAYAWLFAWKATV